MQRFLLNSMMQISTMSLDPLGWFSHWIGSVGDWKRYDMKRRAWMERSPELLKSSGFPHRASAAGLFHPVSSAPLTSNSVRPDPATPTPWSAKWKMPCPRWWVASCRTATTITTVSRSSSKAERTRSPRASRTRGPTFWSSAPSWCSTPPNTHPDRSSPYGETPDCRGELVTQSESPKWNHFYSWVKHTSYIYRGRTKTLVKGWILGRDAYKLVY